MIDRTILEELYLGAKLSVVQIAVQLNCSANKVAYWMKQYGIPCRSISEAVYTRHNPLGDPFTIRPIVTVDDARLLGIGIGLYWGEGTKANRHAVRLGNTDPELLKIFIMFLEKLFDIDHAKLRFGLQIFTDIDPETAMQYWLEHLHAKRSQFYKVTVTISGSLGNYRKRSQYGVVTVYYHNKKLRDILVNMLPR